MPLRVAAWTAVALATLAVIPRAAHALDCKDKREVDVMMERGRRAFSTNHYQQAIGAFTLAYECNHDTSLLFNLAKSHAELGQYLNALDRLRQFRQKSPGLSGDLKSATDLLEEEIESHIGSLEVAGGPSTARLFLDAKDMGMLPLRSLTLESGDHEIRVTAAGYEPHVEVIHVQGRTALTVNVELKPKGLEQAPGWSPSPVFWSGIAVAGAGAALAIVAGAVSATQTSDLAAQCDDRSACAPEFTDDLDEANAWANASNGGLTVFGVGGILTIIGAIVGPFPSATSVSIAPRALGVMVRFE